MTIWRMRIACWKPKATNTHLQYATIIPFPPQQWLRERASLLRYADSTLRSLLAFRCCPVKPSTCESWS